MYLIGGFIVLCSFFGQHVCYQPYKNFNKLYDAEWQCNSICFGSGGKAEYDSENKICKCTLDENIDDADREMILKNANALGVNLILSKALDKAIDKREIDASVQQVENIVGQRAPQRIITPRPRTANRQFSTSRRPTVRTTSLRSTSTRRRTSSRRPVNVQQRLQKIQNRLDERRRSRTRSRSGLHLQQRAGFAEETTPNVMGRLKDRQKERSEKLKSQSPSLGSPKASNSGTMTSAKSGGQTSLPHKDGGNIEKTKGESGTHEKKSHEVITQNPSFY